MVSKFQNEVRFRAYLWRRWDVKRGCQWSPKEQVALLMMCVAVCGHDGGGSVAKVAAELTREGLDSLELADCWQSKVGVPKCRGQTFQWG